MTAPAVALQDAAVAALLAAATVIDLVDSTPDGPAVFAPRQAYGDVFPRLVIDAVLILTRATGCLGAVEAWLTVHALAQGPDSTREAGALADAAQLVLDQVLTFDGWRDAAGDRFKSATPVGDPDPSVEHVVLSLRYRLNPTA